VSFEGVSGDRKNGEERDEGANINDQAEKAQTTAQSTNEVDAQSQSLIITTTLFTAKDATIPTYLLYTNQPIIYVKPLIVLDLNGILCYRLRDRDRISELPIQAASSSNEPSDAQTNTNPAPKTAYRKSIARIANTEIIPRSDLSIFLHLLHQHFSLAVWTSATPKTAKYLVRLLFPDHIRSRLIFVWGRNYCTLVDREKLDVCLDGDVAKGGRKKRRRKNCTVSNDKGVLTEDNAMEKTQNDTKVESETNATNESISTVNCHEDLIAIKSLSKVWSAYPIWNNTNTLLFDDSLEKCPKQFRGNAVHPPPLCGTETSHHGSLDTDETERKETMIDDDEANQSMQRHFFTLLAKHWSSRTDASSLDSDSTSQTTLNEFLTKHASAI
jgi:hypothetical protein